MRSKDTPRITIDVTPLHPGPHDPYAPLAAVSGEAMFPLYDGFDDSVEPSDEYRGYIVGWQEWETLRALEQRFREIAAHIDELGLLMLGMSEDLGNPVELFFGDRPHDDVRLFTEVFSDDLEARDGR